MSTSPRNYKLDRLREKIRGIGRLQIALKKSSPRSNESTESSEQIQNKQSEKGNYCIYTYRFAKHLYVKTVYTGRKAITN